MKSQHSRTSIQNSNMILHDLSSKERPGRRLDGVAGSFQHFSLSENPTTRSQVIGLDTILVSKSLGIIFGITNSITSTYYSLTLINY